MARKVRILAMGMCRCDGECLDEHGNAMAAKARIGWAANC